MTRIVARPKLSPEYKAGFIAGLRQAQRLVGQARTAAVSPAKLIGKEIAWCQAQRKTT